MFTGLIEHVGRVAAVDRAGAGVRLRVETALARELTPGESVAINGVCLTVTRASDDEIAADLGPETLNVTTLGALASGHPVNIERAMRADSRFGGHFVQGHVDGIGTVRSVRQEGQAHWIDIEIPGGLAPYFVRKGSIAVDGISLTVADLGANRFSVMIVPFTWTHTTVGTMQPGTHVNLECDMVGKYVARAVELYRSQEPGPSA
jgi:riboflavin synthase